MKNVVTILLFCGFLACFEADRGWADSPDTCPAKILSSGTIEGVVAETDCGDECYALIVADNGDDFFVTYDEGEPEAQDLFSQKDRKVSVNYDTWQYWHEGGESCLSTQAFVSGRFVDVSSSKAGADNQSGVQGAEATAAAATASNLEVGGFSLGLSRQKFQEQLDSLPEKDRFRCFTFNQPPMLFDQTASGLICISPPNSQFMPGYNDVVDLEEDLTNGKIDPEKYRAELGALVTRYVLLALFDADSDRLWFLERREKLSDPATRPTTVNMIKALMAKYGQLSEEEIRRLYGIDAALAWIFDSNNNITAPSNRASDYQVCSNLLAIQSRATLTFSALSLSYDPPNLTLPLCGPTVEVRFDEAARQGVAPVQDYGISIFDSRIPFESAQKRELQKKQEADKVAVPAF